MKLIIKRGLLAIEFIKKKNFSQLQRFRVSENIIGKPEVLSNNFRQTPYNYLSDGFVFVKPPKGYLTSRAIKFWYFYIRL